MESFVYNEKSPKTPKQQFLDWLFGENEQEEEVWRKIPEGEQRKKIEEKAKEKAKEKGNTDYEMGMIKKAEAEVEKIEKDPKRVELTSLAGEFGAETALQKNKFYNFYKTDSKFREAVDRYTTKKKALDTKIQGKADRIIELKQIQIILKNTTDSQEKKALRLKAAELCYKRSKKSRALDVVTFGLRKKWQKKLSGATDSDIEATLKTEERKFAVMTGKSIEVERKVVDGVETFTTGLENAGKGIGDIFGKYKKGNTAQKRLMDNGRPGLGKGQKILRTMSSIKSGERVEAAKATILQDLKDATKQNIKS